MDLTAFASPESRQTRRRWALLQRVFSIKYLVLSVLVALVLTSAYSLLPTAKAFAQENQTQSSNPYLSPETNPDVPKNLHTFTQSTMLSVMSGMVCQLWGVDVSIPNAKCLGYDKDTGKIGFVEGGGGALGLMGNLIAFTYTPISSSSKYFAYLSDNFGIVKEANAVNEGCNETRLGKGFCSLDPLLNIWSTFRDIAYVFFPGVFVVIGIAIMLRLKIDPRTVMTIENQIPKIIVGIILVTFSFAIAGFLIDLMYLSIYLAATVILSASPSGLDLNAVGTIAQASDPFSAANTIVEGGLGTIVGDPSNAASEISAKVFDNILGRGFFGLIGSIFGAILGGKIAGHFNILGPIGSIIGALVGGIASAVIATELAGFITKVIALLVIGIAVLAALFKLWFSLIIAYINILLDIVLAPFWIIAGIIPGSPINAGAWFRDLIANLAVFPVTIIMFLLAKVFIESFGTPSQYDFVPPMLGNANSPGVIASAPGLLGSFIALGFILMTPSVLDLTKAALKAPKADLGPITRRLGTGPRIVTGAMGTVMSALSLKHYLGAAGFGSGRAKKPTMEAPKGPGAG